MQHRGTKTTLHVSNTHLFGSRAGAPPAGEAIRDIRPVAGTLLLFDSVAVPHEVLAVTAERPRVACTGWFHELLPAP